MELTLSNTDLRWAHWRNIPPESRPPNTSFSLEEAMKKLEKLEQIRSNEHQINWHKLKLTIGLSRAEAHFWIEAIYKGSGQGYSFSVKTVLDYMRREGAIYDGQIGLQELLNLRPMKGYKAFQSGWQLIPAYILLNTADFVQFINDGLKFDYMGDKLEDIFRLHILPYLSLEEKERFRQAIAPYLAANDSAISRSAGLIGIAGLIGGFDTELESYLDKSTPFIGNYLYERWAAFGLSSREKVEHYVRSKKIILHDEYIQAWLAHTELAGLDWLAHSVAQLWRGTNKVKAFKVFKSLLCPESVLPVLNLWAEDNQSSEALQWLVDNRKLVAETLVPLVFTEHPQANLLQKYLQRMHSMQQTALLEAEMLKLDAARQARFHAEIFEIHQSDSREMNESNTPLWLSEAIATVPNNAGMNDWVDILALPPITVDGLRFNPQQIKVLLVALRMYQTESFINAINEHISLEEREAFVWGLFQSCLASAALSSELWTLKAMAKIGGDGVVLKLAPMIERWPTIDHQNRHAKAAIDVLREIGSDLAYIQLKTLSQSKRVTESLKLKIVSRMQDIARQRGLSPQEMEDRLIPDCGLDKNGSRSFDFGSRQFTFVLSPELKPMFREANGKLRADLPKSTQSDDAALVKQAEADWESLKSQIKEVAKVQTTRLETAMIQQRRWSLTDFQKLFVAHPLMLHLIRRLIWGAYDESGKLLETFRVDEARQLLNAEDKALTVAKVVKVVKVGIIHPAELNTTSKQVWGELLSDYEIIPTFPQLARKISGLEQDEATATQIERFASYQVERLVMKSILEKSGWQRSYKQEGTLYYFGKFFATEKTLAIIVCAEVTRISGSYSDLQSVDAAYFINPSTPPRMNYQDYTEAERMPLGAVPPVVFSETVRILHAIAAKAE